ncbi:uncharacterized protein si:dkey-112a7.4 [Osmerus eperlanus]|uniref:uncharacterized protein si:dkey-112a7.4 n=1 Tax=Osmerus eperlanus TaxID=29151 RepID=UPI002E0E14B6
MLYCCGSKDEEKERPDAKNPGVERPKSNKSEPNQESAHRPLAMYGVAAGMPELLPPFGVIQPGTGRSREPNEGPGLGTRFNRGEVSFDSPQRRLGHRAPKLGQIGRSKRVDIDDEDLDDMNNNGPLLPISLSLSPVA